jgi:hypothetical protein
LTTLINRGKTIQDVFNDDFMQMLRATAHAVLSRMRRCIAIFGSRVESYWLREVSIEWVGVKTFLAYM